ncbi:MAG: alpha/beta hydrolase [Chloroflexota bacterium]
MSEKTSTNPWGKIMKIAIIVLLFLLIAYLGICAYAISQVTAIGDHDYYCDTPEDFGIDYQEVTFHATIDELQIAAWYLPHPGSEKAVIIVHGRDASKQWAESGTIVAFQADLYKAGYTVLAIDVRGHGDSDEARYSFGVYERRDVLGAVDFLLNKGFKPGNIGVVGISLGGAAANGAMAESEAIGAVVTEGTFAEFYPIVEEQWQNESGLPNFFLPGVLLMNRIMYGYSLADVNPAAEIAQAEPRPMLIIHCTEDDMVPMSHPGELLEAAPHAESWIMSSCDHAELYRDYPEEYSQHVITFFDENL